MEVPSINTTSVEEYSFSCLIREPNLTLSKQEVYTNAQIFREDKLHIVGVTDGFVEWLGFVKVLLMGHGWISYSWKFPKPTGKNFSNRFFERKYSDAYQVRCAGIHEIARHNNSMYKTGCRFDPYKEPKYFILKQKIQKSRLVLRLFGNGLYAGNALVKNRGGKAYIKIINTRDTDERIVAPEVELKQLDKID